MVMHMCDCVWVDDKNSNITNNYYHKLPVMVLITTMLIILIKIAINGDNNDHDNKHITSNY